MVQGQAARQRWSVLSGWGDAKRSKRDGLLDPIILRAIREVGGKRYLADRNPLMTILVRRTLMFCE